MDMVNVRKTRKALKPIWPLLNPKPFTWTGNKAFARVRDKKFHKLANILYHDDFMSLCAAVGWVEVNWAFVESQMDRWVQVAFVKLKVRHGGNDVPLSFKKKADYLKHAFKHPYLTKFKARGLSLVADMEQLSVTRHDLTHGVITTVEPIDLYSYEFVNRKLQSRTGMHTTKSFTLDFREFPVLAKRFVDLGARSVQLSADFANTFL